MIKYIEHTPHRIKNSIGAYLRANLLKEFQRTHKLEEKGTKKMPPQFTLVYNVAVSSLKGSDRGS